MYNMVYWCFDIGFICPVEKIEFENTHLLSPERELVYFYPRSDMLKLNGSASAEN